ncbi:MAG: Ig-like domain-containing protein [Planctomycetota bacterium]|jgi:hypothetical protein
MAPASLWKLERGVLSPPGRLERVEFVGFTYRNLKVLAALLTLMGSPSAAWSVQIFEGNLGYDGDWLHVIDAEGMGSRVYWYESPDDVTYRVQFARDEAFDVVVSDMGQVVNNYVAPGLAPGFYYFRVSETNSEGNSGGWSERGTLAVVEDREAPSLEIISPVDGQTFYQGETLSVELEVSDDSVLHRARFAADGSYAGALGLKTENSRSRRRARPGRWRSP